MSAGEVDDFRKILLLNSPPIRTISGFWRRFAAFGIDCLLLGIIGSALGIFFSDFFQHLGIWGTVLGFAIALPYFGLLNSSIGNGQTLGKRLMHIRVVDRDGQTISLRISLIRYSILATLWFLNIGMLPASFGASWFGMEVGAFLSGVQLSVAYLYVFNRQTRQSLHDFMVGTYVVESVPNGRVEAPPVWKGHGYVMVPVVVTLLVIIPLNAFRIMHSGPFLELMVIGQAVQKMDNVGAASVFQIGRLGTNISMPLTVTVNWKRRPQNEEMEATKVAAQVLAADPQAANRRSLVIRTVNGYTIGIASAFRSRNFEYAPEQWREKIRLVSPNQGAVAPWQRK